MCLSLAFAALLALPQGGEPEFAPSPNGMLLSAEPVPGALRTAVTVALPWGLDDDPAGAAGLAVAAGHYLLLRSAPLLPPAMRAQVEVLGDTTLFAVLGAPGDTAALLRWASALGGAAVAGDDSDPLQLARARAALLADDAEAVFPGLVLHSRARRALWRGQPEGRWPRGEPTQIQELALDTIRQRAAAMAAGETFVQLLGAIDEVALTAASAWPPRPRLRVERDAAVARDLPEAGELLQPLRGVGGPYVAAAFPAPAAGPGSTSFLLAMAIARLRAASAFRDLRGHELAAQAPAFSYDWLRSDRVVLVTRRGPDGGQLADTRRELEAQLRQFTARPLDVAELQAAVRRCRAELQLPPYPAALQQALRLAPEALPARARVLVLCARRHWPFTLGEDLGTLPLGVVQQAFLEALDPARAWFGAVGPRQLPERR